MGGPPRPAPGRDLQGSSKETLLPEPGEVETVEGRFAATAGEDRVRLIDELHAREIELETQNQELREAQERLEEALSRSSDLYDSAPVGYCTLDLDGRIRDLNRTAATLLGASREGLIGGLFLYVAPLKDGRPFRAHMRRCQAERGRVTSELTLSIGKRESRTVQIISDPVRDPSGATTAYRTILVDISELKALESRLQLLSTAGERLASSVDYALTIEEAARIAVPALSDLCTIDVARTSGVVERRVVLFADPNRQATVSERMMRFAARPGRETAQTRVIASGEPLLLPEVSDQLREWTSDDDRDADVLQSTDVRSLIVVPLTARGRVLGALTLVSAESDRRYSSIDLQVAQDLSSRIAIALDNARLYEEAQRTNEALRLAEAKASGIVSMAADAIISVDRELRITLFNEGAEKIFGYSRAEVLGAPLDDLIPERFRAGHRQHVERFLAGHGSRRMGERGTVLRGLRKNGEEFPADAAISNLEVGGERILTVVLRDVTDMQRRERDQRLLADMGPLLASTLDYEETLTRLADLVVRDLADFCLVDVVDDEGVIRRLRITARDPSRERICVALRQLEIDLDRPGPIWSSVKTGQPVLIESVTPEIVDSWGQSEEHLRMLREMDPKSVIVAPMMARGKIVGLLKVVSSARPGAYGQEDLRLMAEVASRAGLAIDNARLYRKAERAIHARDKVLGVVAHDLRNPLGNILMQAMLLRRPGGESDRRSHKPADVIERAAARMNRLIQDLLDVTRMEAGGIAIERAPLSPGGTLSEFIEAQTPLAASRSVELRLEVDPELGEVFADRDRLLQVLENLVANAVKFTRPGGRVTVGAARRDGEILFRVADTGVGVASEDLPHLFDLFWQAGRTDRQGVGLGLPIVKGIVEAHGGRVWVESQVGKGSTFFFTLPLGDPALTATIRWENEVPIAKINH